MKGPRCWQPHHAADVEQRQSRPFAGSRPRDAASVVLVHRSVALLPQRASPRVGNRDSRGTDCEIGKPRPWHESGVRESGVGESLSVVRDVTAEQPSRRGPEAAKETGRAHAWVDPVRRAAAVVGGAYVATWVPALAVTFLDLGPAVGWPLLVAAVLLGGYAGHRQRLDPIDAQEHRDGVIGWSVVLALIGGIVAQFLPVPWNLVATVAWLAVVMITARTLLGSTSVAERRRALP